MGPIVHKPSALLKQVASSISCLYLARDRMGQGHFDNFGRIAGAFGRPVAEGRPEAVRDEFGLHPPHKLKERHVAQRLSGAAAHEQELAPARQSFENFKSTV